MEGRHDLAVPALGRPGRDRKGRPPMTSPIRKRSYTVPCSSVFRDRASAHAEKLNVHVADLARSAVLLAPQNVIADFPDPGPPASGDRETVILKSGPAKGRPWRRKPRLQVRMGPGLTVLFIRRYLALALAVGEGRLRIRIESTGPAAVAEVEFLTRKRSRRQILRRSANCMTRPSTYGPSSRRSRSNPSPAASKPVRMRSTSSAWPRTTGPTPRH